MADTTQTKYLTALLAGALKRQPAAVDLSSLDETQARQLLELARAHAVSAFLYEEWKESQSADAGVCAALEKDARQVISHSYRMLFYTSYLVDLLEAEGITVAVLKGVATAEYYPQPELRKTGDVDLLLFSDEDCARAVQCLKRHGFAEHGASHQHHVAMMGAEQIEVELHRLLTEPFADEAVNEKLLKILWQSEKALRRQPCMGVSLPVLCGAEHGMTLLLHLLQHFLTAGFGIKLLCDWVVFWERQSEQEAVRCAQMSRELGIGRFAAVVSAVCTDALGMDAQAAEPFLQDAPAKLLEPSYLEQFLADVVESEEFGTSVEGRMVALQARGLRGYVRTFHHQMKLNYPRAGRYVPLYPLLWLCTLIRFLHNNRTLRKTSVRSILKSADARARLTERLQLFADTDADASKT